jgi:uncharacterized membrane protein YraQ (UPF0718 family)
MTGGVTAGSAAGAPLALPVLASVPPAPPPVPPATGRQVAAGLSLALAGGVLYRELPGFAAWIAESVLGLEPGSAAEKAASFFLFETPKVLLLLTAVVFVVGVVRTFVTPARARRALAGRREAGGSLLAALLGVVTPFCSCSAVPMFLGFVTAGVPLGVTFSFLVSAPMVNEVALGLLLALFGWRIAALYVVTGLFVAVVSGWVIGRLKLERWVEAWVFSTREGGSAGEPALSVRQRLTLGARSVREIVGKVWPWVAAGIGVGASIHGWVPEHFLASILGRGAWWSVPLAVLIGIPMYANAAGILPVVQALLGKGAALGTALAFMMSVIALSLPEMIILRRVLMPKLIAVFAGVVGAGILLVGYLFNALL